MDEQLRDFSRRIRVLEDQLRRREFAEIVRRIEALEAAFDKSARGRAAK